jgi:3-methyladenine DNA glycosylase AlkD
MDDVLTLIRKDLMRHNSDEHKESNQRFFKEPVNMYGVKMPIVKEIGKRYYKKVAALGKEEIFGLCDDLWKSRMYEEGIIASHWSYNLREQYDMSDYRIFEGWIENYVTNWATCDTLCNHTVGALIEKYPSIISVLKTWALSKNRWLRRASAVSLIVPARHGKFLKEIFEICELLLTDDDDLVQKGYGWLLKSAGEAHLNNIFTFVMNHKAVMPRTALRYAIEKMPDNLREKVLSKD